MDAGQIALVVAAVGLLGTALGAVIAGGMTLRVTRENNRHAAELARDQRAHEEKVRRKSAGGASADAVLTHIDRMRAVFDDWTDRWGTPEQRSYKLAYEAVPLASVDIDDEAVAEVLTDIAYAYYHAFLAVEDGSWTTWSLNRALFNLAHRTVRFYKQGGDLPARDELDKIMSDIDFNIETREENERQSREAWLQEQKAEREAEAEKLRSAPT